MNEVEQLAPGDIWDKVSDDAKKLAISLFHSQGFSQARDYIEDMAQDKDGGFDLEQGMQGLSDFGVLQEITLIEEKKERLTQMKTPRAILLTPITELRDEQLRERLSLKTKMTAEEREYLRLGREIEEYEQNREKRPDRYKGWEEPRYRLRSDFQAFIKKSFF